MIEPTGTLSPSPQFGSQPLHAAVVHHCVFLKEGKFLIVQVGMFALQIQKGRKENKHQINENPQFFTVRNTFTP